MIIGVGPADFSNMLVLDADEHALSSGGRVAVRVTLKFLEQWPTFLERARLSRHCCIA